MFVVGNVFFVWFWTLGYVRYWLFCGAGCSWRPLVGSPPTPPITLRATRDFLLNSKSIKFGGMIQIDIPPTVFKFRGSEELEAQRDLIFSLSSHLVNLLLDCMGRA